MHSEPWPEPPMHDADSPPPVPERYSLFGVWYRTVDGNPEIDMPHEPLDAAWLRQAVVESFDTFAHLVEAFDPQYLNRLRDQHIKINEALNKAAKHRGDWALRQARQEQTKIKREIYTKIKRILE
ncbi:hypothetical protein PAPHI01_0081 [Pancytospora philotis]|nr:hypothetical protein PAPHI01_0081 [Pancytospora philotis]